MRLQTVPLDGRSFVPQFFSIMNEFGDEIPWLDGLSEARFLLDGNVFAQQILRNTKQPDNGITPYQFVSDEFPGGLFVGGAVHFKESPERFTNTRLCEAAESLAASGASFISCLQVRPPHRSRGIGGTMFPQALDLLVRERGSFWGVVSDVRVLRWHLSLGAQLLTPMESVDGIWIIYWGDEPFVM